LQNGLITNLNSKYSVDYIIYMKHDLTESVVIPILNALTILSIIFLKYATEVIIERSQIHIVHHISNQILV
jgi:hypothetical protein